MEFTLRYKKLHPNAIPPQKSYESALGWDLFLAEEAIVGPFNRLLLKTGIAFEFPPNFGGILKDRSGVASKQGLFIHAGVIDPDYRGEVQVLMYNSNRTPVQIAAGAKIAQMILLPVFVVSELIEVEELNSTDRGDKGFGSSGG